MLKCLKLLRDGAQSLREEEIADRIHEDKLYVAKALEKLRQVNVLDKVKEYYSYQKTSANEEFLERMLEVYDRIDKLSEMESLVIGLLSAAAQDKDLLRQNTLLRVLGEEGFDCKEISILLQKQVSEGWVRRLRVAVRKETEESSPVPPAIPWHYTSRIIRMNEEGYEKVTKRWVDEGFFVQEEDYLIGAFPPETAYPATEYLYNEMAYVKQKIKDEPFSGWLGLRIGCNYFDLE